MCKRVSVVTARHASCRLRHGQPTGCLDLDDRVRPDAESPDNERVDHLGIQAVAFQARRGIAARQVARALAPARTSFAGCAQHLERRGISDLEDQS